MTNVDLLPAAAIPEDALTAEPLADPAVGDIVVTWTRGAHRLAQVTKVGPKRVEVIYTTQGAWTQAQKIYEHALAYPAQIAKIEADVRRAENKNFDYYEGLASGSYISRGFDLALKTDGTPDVDRIEKAKQQIAPGREAHVDAQVAKVKADVEAAYEKAKAGGVAQYVHVTKKSCKREDIYGLAA